MIVVQNAKTVSRAPHIPFRHDPVDRLERNNHRRNRKVWCLSEASFKFIRVWLWSSGLAGPGFIFSSLDQAKEERLLSVCLSNLARWGGSWVCFLLLTLFISNATAQSTCDGPTLDAASDAYDIGRFPQTFTLLKPCLPDGFSGKSQQVDAYRLMTLTYIATDSLEQARISIRQLLNADSRYQPDGVNDPPLFANLVSDLKPKWYTWLWRGKQWYKWAGRGAVAGVVSLPFLLKTTPEPDLPGNPVFPTGE
jgi:hypothetical protein